MRRRTEEESMKASIRKIGRRRRRRKEGGKREWKGGRGREEGGGSEPAFCEFMAFMISCIRYHPSSASSGVFACSRGRWGGNGN